MVPDPVDFCIAQDMVAVRADPRKVHPNYLFAALRSREVQTQIGTMHVGTMIPHFKKGDFGKLLIPMPPRDLQELIGNTYVELSKKIESNSRIAKLARQLLAARFASESSLVVWDVPLAEWAVLSRGVEPGRDKCNQDGDGLPFIRVGDLGKDDTGLWTNTDTSAVARETDVLVSFDGTPGRVAVGMTGVFSSGIRRVDPVNGLVTPGVLLALFESAEVQQVIRDYATGTTILHAGASIPHIKVPALDSTVLRSLAAEADELVARLRASTRESGVLRRTRDALLEDLLSGHLRVREAEEVVGSA
jgi:type I restriction enzyme S subunit